MLWIDLLLRWLHIINAVVLGGGLLFWRLAFWTGTQTLAEATRRDVQIAVRTRWSKLVAVSSGFLLVTGLINFFLIVQRYSIDKSEFPGNIYHALFGVKFLLSMAIFLFAALLAGRTSAAEKLRRNERMWLDATVVLVIAVICLGGLLRASKRELKTAPSLQSAARFETEGSSSPNRLTPALIGD